MCYINRRTDIAIGSFCFNKPDFCLTFVHTSTIRYEEINFFYLMGVSKLIRRSRLLF